MRRALLLFSLLLGCRSYAYKLPTQPASLPPPPPPPAEKLAIDESDTSTAGNICEIDPSACAKPMLDQQRVTAKKTLNAEVYAVQQSYPGALALGGGGAPAPPPPPPLPAAPEAAQAREMIDIEARFAVECASVPQAREKFRELVHANEGTLTLDEANTQEHVSEATFEARVPIARYEALTRALAEIGQIRAREVKAKDVAKEYHDTELLLRNLEAAMTRYEELLKKANAVPDVLAIERELERLRNRIDRAKGDLAWMKDRVARATVRVRLFPTPTSEETPLASSSPFYPGVRFVTLFDLRGESDRFGYAGGGLSLEFHDTVGRALVLELDLARTAFTDRPPESNYAYLALGGIDFYSDLLGGGRRTFLNPYLGMRAGYAQTAARGDLALGGVVALEFVKTRSLLLGLQLRALALVGNDGGPHVALGPTLGANVAF